MNFHQSVWFWVQVFLLQPVDKLPSGSSLLQKDEHVPTGVGTKCSVHPSGGLEPCGSWDRSLIPKTSTFYTSCHKESRIFTDSYLRVCGLESIEKLCEEYPLMLPGANNTGLSDDICCLRLSCFCFSPDIVIESDCFVKFLDSIKKHPLLIFSFLFLHGSFSVPSAEEFLPVMYH